MKFDEAVESIWRITELRRIAGAHVVDHRQLTNDELKAAIIKTKPQYMHEPTVRQNLERALFWDPRTDYRVLSRLILVDVLLDQYDFELPSPDLDALVISFEQSVVNRSNEIDLVDLGCASRGSRRFQNLELYNFVLSVAWDNANTKTPDEVNLLRKLRDRLMITESDHRFIEAKLGFYPKISNELHSRTEINDVRKYLQGLGLIFAIRHDDDADVDIIPEELGRILRDILGLELRKDSYRTLMTYRLIRRRAHLTEVLNRSGIEYGRGDTVDTLVRLVLEYVKPSKAFASTAPPRFGLTSDQLTAWCRELNEQVSGSMEERIRRVITHFDQLRPRLEQKVDERELWYEFFEELAARNHETLRAQHIIDKDLEIEAKFEDATEYLFAEKLNHRPLQQDRSNHPDGLLSLGANYVMWDNKSKESPVNLREHLRQFDAYMDQADKPVPIFLVIGPSFTDDSESEAIRYHARHFDRNICLITAGELKLLADEWSSQENRNQEDPFPLGLLAATGRFNRTRLGKLF